MSDELARSVEDLREKVDIERKAEREGSMYELVREMGEYSTVASRKIVRAYAPNLCDICRGTLRTGPSFYDGRTLTGPWAWMCSVCFEEHGVGLGTGSGQQYSSATNEKEAG